MVEWELFSVNRNEADWDQFLLQSQDYNVFQSSRWGEYKRASGWTPLRLIARNETGAVVAMTQVLTKDFPAGIQISWAPGGPILRFSDDLPHDLHLTIEGLLAAIKTVGSRVYIRLDSYLPNSADLANVFGQSCARPRFKINTGYSSCLDLLQSPDMLRKQAKRKHRYYVKKALSQGIQWKCGSGPGFVQELVDLHSEMIRRKGLPTLRTSRTEICTLCKIMGDQASIFTGYVDDKAVASCLVLSIGQKAFYWMGATSNSGRQLSASYALVDQLLEYLQSKDIAQFDFGGLNLKRNSSGAGVDHFKKGFGGKLVERLGEWEWVSSEWLRWAVNAAVSYRGREL